MKMRAAQKVHYDAGPNMTPLVDVVMVILIFLMLTGSFAVGEHFLQSNMPVTKKGAGQVNDKSVPDEPLEIRVDSFTRPGPDGVSVDMWAAQAGGFMIQNNLEQLVVQLRSEEHTSELQSQSNLVCRLLLEQKKQTTWNAALSLC